MPTIDILDVAIGDVVNASAKLDSRSHLRSEGEIVANRVAYLELQDAIGRLKVAFAAQQQTA